MKTTTKNINKNKTVIINGQKFIRKNDCLMFVGSINTLDSFHTYQGQQKRVLTY